MVKYRHCDGMLVCKVTDDKVVSDCQPALKVQSLISLDLSLSPTVLEASN